ncbi:hypothetical protein ANN_25336 [Periplaneta americana]|uniref:Uncharacterized protein n=1 Tax=Periplaneta americana TaxID=6978 RepID=A0ABQ8S174_PERAM|nr:hypothetical protein ANN_25336 [Periplaneta americana]
MAGLCEGGAEPVGSLKAIYVIRTRSLNWAGHVIRVDDCTSAKQIYMNTSNNRRPLERPRNRWKDEIQKECMKMRITNWEELAKDRTERKRFVKSTCSRHAP